MDSRLRGNDINCIFAVVPAKAGIHTACPNTSARMRALRPRADDRYSVDTATPRSSESRAARQLARCVRSASITGPGPRLPPPPEAERLGRLLHEHPEAVGGDRGAPFRTPAHERGRLRRVGGVVGDAADTQGARGQGRKIAGEARGGGSALTTTSNLAAASASNTAVLTGPCPAKRPASSTARDGVRLAITSSRGASSSSGPTMPRAAPPAPSTSTERSRRIDREIAHEIPNQPDPVGVVAADVRCLEPQRVDRPRTLRTLRTAARQRERLLLERNRHVESAAAFRAEAFDGLAEAARLDVQRVVCDGLTGLGREPPVDER